MRSDMAKILLDRYLKGETSVTENRLVEDWLETNNYSAAQWNQLDEPQRKQQLTKVFDTIKATISTEKPKVVKLKSRLQWLKIAAAVAILVISVTIYWERKFMQSIFNPAQLTSMQTMGNEKKQVILPDGSKVWINSDSELRYPKTFDGKTREVYLSGEAYFDIAHDRDHPFIIHTGSIATTVLGTAFNIRANMIKKIVEVTVTRGKVSVANSEKVLAVLTPNQQLSFDINKDRGEQQQVNVQKVIAWQKSDLYFDDVNFEEAVVKLQNHFNVRINFANDQLKNCRFTGTNLNNEKLEKILNVMCAINQASYQKQPDGSILIDGPGCPK